MWFEWALTTHGGIRSPSQSAGRPCTFMPLGNKMKVGHGLNRSQVSCHMRNRTHTFSTPSSDIEGDVHLGYRPLTTLQSTSGALRFGNLRIGSRAVRG